VILKTQDKYVSFCLAVVVAVVAVVAVVDFWVGS
jgi:hypothetical protein